MMKNIFSLVLFLSLSVCAISQSDTVFYNTVIDFDGQKKRFDKWPGYWTYSDSIVIHNIDGTALVYPVIKVDLTNVLYKNDWDEPVIITIDESTSGILRKSIVRPKEYTLFILK